MKIKNIHAREIIDSRGNPTIEVKVTLKNGISARAGVPSGASTGIHEAWELRDHEMKRYNGKGVLKAVKNVNQKLNRLFADFDVTKQRDIDNAMIKLDGTVNKSRIGANAMLGVSLATARAASVAKRKPLYISLRQYYKFPYQNFSLPVPTFNIFNGGKHADTNLDVQEIMVIPTKMKLFRERVRAGYEIFSSLGGVLSDEGLDTDVGNEGGYAPHVQSTEHALKLVISAIKRAGYHPGEDVFLGTDIGASELYNQKTKKYSFVSDKLLMDNDEMVDFMERLSRDFPFLSIEDPLDQDEWTHWQSLTERLGRKITIVGDDLFVTNKKRIQKGIDMGVANAVLIKVNQIGTLSETIDSIVLAKENDYKTIISHRSGETTDDFIADLAVATNADFVKMGSSRGERVCKYNRIMEIEEEVKH